MSWRRVLGAVCGLASTAAVVAVPASASASPAVATPMVQAYEWDTAAPDGTGGAATWCSSVTDPTLPGVGGYACFQKYGDKWWAQDVQGDGFSITASWKNYLWNGSSWVFYRQGSCVNSGGADGVWRACNKDYYEDSTYPNAVGGQGSYVVWSACMYNARTGQFDVCGDSNWVYNDA